MDQAYWGKVALLFGITLVISLILTAVVRKVALSRGLVDVPGDERRVHKVAVPRLGGLAMYAAFAIGVVLTLVGPLTIARVTDPNSNNRFEPTRILLLLVGAGIVTAVMAVDDIRSLKPLPRLFCQIGAALLVIVPGLLWPGGPNAGEAPGTVHYDQGAGILTTSIQSPFGGALVFPLAIAVLFTAFWIVGMTNTINWIDGLDGLAAGVTLVACLVLFYITGPVLGQYSLSYLPLILGAAILGFLPFNIHPARIFMGDSGAMFLGFTLAILALIGGAKVAAALLVLGVPMLDAAYRIIFRLSRRRSPMSPDRGHLHHRLLDMGLSQQRVVVIFYILAGVFGLLAVMLTQLWWTNLLSQTVATAIKLAAFVLLGVLLLAALVFISRRQFDREAARDKH